VQVRVGTWNLERGGQRGLRSASQLSVLEALNLDVVVLTEPAASLSAGRDGVVASPARRAGPVGLEAWVAIVGSGVVPIGPPLPFERLAAAARLRANGRDIILYGSVLPWRSAPLHVPDLTLPGESSADMFVRFLDVQKQDVALLQKSYPDALVVWAGDFNQSLTGPNVVGSARGRVALGAALEGLGFQAWNSEQVHAHAALRTIDLICGPVEQPIRSVERIDPVTNGRRLSDHAGYVVDLVF
jgi:hypothetical protein